MLLAQDVTANVPIDDQIVRAVLFADADEHQRLERDGRKGVGRHSVDTALMPRRHHRDAGGEMAQGSAKTSRIKRHWIAPSFTSVAHATNEIKFPHHHFRIIKRKGR